MLNVVVLHVCKTWNNVWVALRVLVASACICTSSVIGCKWRHTQEVSCAAESEFIWTCTLELQPQRSLNHWNNSFIHLSLISTLTSILSVVTVYSQHQLEQTQYNENPLVLSQNVRNLWHTGNLLSDTIRFKCWRHTNNIVSVQHEH